MGDKIEILVTDDGRGMSPERLEQITAGSSPIKDAARVHIGLYNIRQRLKIIYQNEETMEIISSPGKGASIRITYPFRSSTPK